MPTPADDEAKREEEDGTTLDPTGNAGGTSRPPPPPAASLSIADLTAVTMSVVAALNHLGIGQPAPVAAVQQTAPAGPRVFFPVITHVTNLSAFNSNKTWENKETHLAYHRGNWDTWKERLIRCLGLVALDRYIDAYPGTNQYMPRPVLRATSTYEEQKSEHNWAENDASARRLMRSVMDESEYREVKHCGTARAMFALLQTRFSAGTAITLYTLWDRLLNVRVHASFADEFHKALADVREITDRIFAIGAPSQDDVMVMALLRALDTDGATHIQRSLTNDVAKDELTLDVMTRRYRTEAEYLVSKGLTTDQTIAMIVTDDTQCLRCGGWGHIARKCASSPHVSDTPKVKAALAKSTTAPTPARAGPFRSHLPLRGGRGGQRGRGGRGGGRGGRGGTFAVLSVDGSSPSAVEYDGQTFYPAYNTAAAVLSEPYAQLEEEYASDGDGTDWTASLEVDVKHADLHETNAIIASEPDIIEEDAVFAALVNLPRPPAIPLNGAVPESPYDLTTNPHTIAHVGALEWFLDSGATMHCTPDESDLTNIRSITPIPIRGVNGQRMYATKIGSVVFKLKDKRKLTVNGVLLIPDAALHLISIGRLADAGLDSRFSRHHATIIREGTEKIAATATRVGRGLYSIDLSHALEQSINAASSGVPIQTWHGRLGHPAENHVERLVKSGAVSGMHVDLSVHPPACQHCIVGKQTVAAMPKLREGERSRAFLDTVFIDLTGSHNRTATPSGEKYTMSVKDDHTHWLWSFLLRTKDDAFNKIVAWHNRIKRVSGKSVGTIQIDNGELKSADFETWAASEGITVRFTAPHSSAQNGRVERTHRTIDNCARAMRIASGLPETTWGEFVLTSAYLHNYRLTRALADKKTPYEQRFNKKPDISHLREIGCKAFVLIQNIHVTKIQPKSIECIFVGYDTASKSYRCWHKASRKIIVSRNVRFVESHMLEPRPYKPGVVIGLPSVPGGADPAPFGGAGMCSWACEREVSGNGTRSRTGRSYPAPAERARHAPQVAEGHHRGRAR
jgi:hypothetical protein